jgi:hypothetical protein
MEERWINISTACNFADSIKGKKHDIIKLMLRESTAIRFWGLENYMWY